MSCRFYIGVLLIALIPTQANTDSIVIDGQLYTNVNIFETANRYYVRLPSADPMTIEKSAVKPGEIVIGDETIAKPFAEKVPDPIPTPAPAPTPKDDPPKLTPTPKIARAPIGTLYAGAARVFIPEATSTREANAIVLRSGDVFVAFCALDATFVGRDFVKNAADELKRIGSAITFDALIVSATGIPTADAPSSTWTPFAPHQAGGKDTDALTNAITQAVFKAEQQLAPATFRAAEAESPDYHKVRDGGSVTPDSTLSVLLVEALDGAARAYLVNYAVYPYPHTDPSAKSTRGVPGFLAEALRHQSTPETPVLFINGAAGDIIPKAPTGDIIPKAPAGGDPAHLEQSIGQALARAATAAISFAEPQETVALTRITSDVTLPNTLFTDDFPATTVLQEVHLGDTVLLSFPAALAAQIGLLMRVKAFEQGAEQVFLMTHTGDFLGYHPTIEEFFTVTPQTRRAPFGPLMLKWYGDHHLEATDQIASEPAWRNAPALGRYAESFTAGIARGVERRSALNQKWHASKGALERLCRVFFVESTDLSQEANIILADLPEDKTATAFQHFAALFIRERYAIFTEEERAILMGIAEGANLPFDAVLILQTLSAPAAMPDKAVTIVQQLGLTGINFLDSAAELTGTV